jgi:hypothetical protein
MGVPWHHVRFWLSVGVLVLLAAAAFSVGLADGRERLIGGFLSGLTGAIHAAVGIVASLILGVAALFRRVRNAPLARGMGLLLAIGWLGWIAGALLAVAQGPAFRYTGLFSITAGSLARTEIPIECVSVVGDPRVLSSIYSEFVVNGVSFNMGVRDQGDGTPIVGAAGTIDIDGAEFFLGRADSSTIDGLRGEAILTATVFDQAGDPGSSTQVDVTWVCDPATGTPNR